MRSFTFDCVLILLLPCQQLFISFSALSYILEWFWNCFDIVIFLPGVWPSVSWSLSLSVPGLCPSRWVPGICPFLVSVRSAGSLSVPRLCPSSWVPGLCPFLVSIRLFGFLVSVRPAGSIVSVRLRSLDAAPNDRSLTCKCPPHILGVRFGYPVRSWSLSVLLGSWSLSVPGLCPFCWVPGLCVFLGACTPSKNEWSILSVRLRSFDAASNDRSLTCKCPPRMATILQDRMCLAARCRHESV